MTLSTHLSNPLLRLEHSIVLDDKGVFLFCIIFIGLVGASDYRVGYNMCHEICARNNGEMHPMLTTLSLTLPAFQGIPILCQAKVLLSQAAFRITT